MKFRSTDMLRAAVLIAVGIALGSCETIRDAAGMMKTPPDEFAVLTKAPLVVPPDYNLMPPRPGAPPTNQTEPTDSAQSALFGSDPATIAANLTGDYSQGEKILLANAGVAGIDPAIRQHLASDHKAMLGADDSFTNSVLFWKAPKTDTGTAVDADAEARRMDAQKSGAAPGAAPTAAPDQAPKKQEDKSGWFDGWFDWF